MALCAVYVAVLVTSLVAATTGFTTIDQVTGPAMIVFGCLGGYFAVRAARHPGLDRRSRLAWRFVAVAFVFILATPVLFLLVTGARPFPQPGDGTHLVAVAVLAVAVSPKP